MKQFPFWNSDVKFHFNLNSREAQETLTDVHGVGSGMSLTALLV